MKKSLILLLFIVWHITAQSQTFDRGIERNTFVPKGQWVTGGNISYSQYGLDDYKALIISDINGNGYTVNVSPFLGYFVADNTAVGIRLGYKRSLIDLAGASLDFGDETTADVGAFYSVEHIYSGTAMMRNYLSLGNSKRFGLYNEVRLLFGGGQSKNLYGSGEEMTGTYQNIFEFQVGLAPGLVAFITNNLAVECSVGVLGYKYKKRWQTRDQIYKGDYTNSSANFKVDLFSINLGLSFYIPTLKPSFKKK